MNQVYIETFGCQMNERDSEIMAQALSRHHYGLVSRPEEADLIVVNTCSIRGKAAQKAYSSLGRYRLLKKKKPGLLVAVAGCVAQQDGASLLTKMPFLDLVLGPRAIYRLPELLAEARIGKKQVLATEQSPDFTIPAFLPEPKSGLPHKRFVTIMQGCDNFCTYCVVPYTRGREMSRNFTDIINEVRHLLDLGVQEITLIGQNVNSYGRGLPGEPPPSFPKLLRAVAELDGLTRLRFTTSHPKDLSEELMDCFAEIPKLCPHFHLPVQSGSNRVLEAMNRRYTIESYLDKVKGLKERRPDLALTTDIIVGFPGETEADFAATMNLLETVRYHGAYSFKYSDRPKAKAAGFANKVDEAVKAERLAKLQARQEEITAERRREAIGKILTAMVEGISRAAGGQWSGRTGCNQIVNFYSERRLIPGELVDILIEEACQNSLKGTPAP